KVPRSIIGEGLKLSEKLCPAHTDFTTKDLYSKNSIRHMFYNDFQRMIQKLLIHGRDVNAYRLQDDFPAEVFPQLSPALDKIFHPCQEFGGYKRLDQVIIGPGFQPFDLISATSSCG